MRSTSKVSCRAPSGYAGERVTLGCELEVRCLVEGSAAYKHARGIICPSFGEGFDFSGVEAMMSGGAVVASDIAVHHEIYSDAAQFRNPCSMTDLAKAITEVIDPAQKIASG